MFKFKTASKWALVIGAIAITSMATPKEVHAQTVLSRTLTSYYFYRILLSSRLSISLPARDLNGIALNGTYLDDRYITGIALDDVLIRGHKTRSLSLKGTRFKPHKKLEGALFTAHLDDGSLLDIRIDKVERRKDRADPEVIHYFASYEADDGWHPLCGVDEEGRPIGAIPLTGRWDYTQGTETGGAKIDDEGMFTFACQGYVLHKCVDAGYKPWHKVIACTDRRHCETISLADYHQACTRMMRADFCGDGTSYTVDDIVVAMYDGFGIRYDSEPWDLEAEWDEDGAICLQQARIPEDPPSCVDHLLDDTCGDPEHFRDGVLLISELP